MVHWLFGAHCYSSCFCQALQISLLPHPVSSLVQRPLHCSSRSLLFLSVRALLVCSLACFIVRLLSAHLITNHSTKSGKASASSRFPIPVTQPLPNHPTQCLLGITGNRHLAFRPQHSCYTPPFLPVHHPLTYLPDAGTRGPEAHRYLDLALFRPSSKVEFFFST